MHKYGDASTREHDVWPNIGYPEIRPVTAKAGMPEEVPKLDLWLRISPAVSQHDGARGKRERRGISRVGRAKRPDATKSIDVRPLIDKVRAIRLRAEATGACSRDKAPSWM